MKIHAGNKYIEVDAYRFFNTNKRYKWFDWVSNKKDAVAKVKHFRGQGHLARLVAESTGGYSIYTHAQ